ncbi:MAG TPA: hypothetical protein VHO03_16530 [Ignavibacteriales bacterium]|nr:hypothetical protein [Ignavibacteriales bacterium]
MTLEDKILCVITKQPYYDEETQTVKGNKGQVDNVRELIESYCKKQKEICVKAMFPKEKEYLSREEKQIEQAILNAELATIADNQSNGN